jgi:hypothetical protein
MTSRQSDIAKGLRCELDLARQHARFMPSGVWPVLNMKKMRYLFLVLALGFGLCAQRAPAQTAAQTMTFSIICQYATNTFTNINVSSDTTNVHQQIITVLLDSANIAKAIAIDLEGTNWNRSGTNSTNWTGAAIVYEENLQSGNQGIYLRLPDKQTNVSSFFTNIFSTNGLTNMFSQNASNVFNGINYTMSGTNPSTLPLYGGYDYDMGGTNNTTNNTAYGNFAYLTVATTNISFDLFGFSQGTFTNVVGRYQEQTYSNKVIKAEIIGVGTFSLNLTTNIYLYLTNNSPYMDNPNFILPTNYTGLAHGTVFVNAPYYLNIGPPEGP